jgi:multidrug efflux pump subunit AcrB
MDMILKGPIWTSPEQLASIPVATPLAGLQTLGELTDIKRTVGPTQLLRVNGQRTLTLSVTPPADMTVQEALDSLRDVAGPQIQELMPADVTLAYRGTADRLEAAFSSMAVNLATAAVVLFLIMAAMRPSSCFRCPSRLRAVSAHCACSISSLSRPWTC